MGAYANVWECEYECMSIEIYENRLIRMVIYQHGNVWEFKYMRKEMYGNKKTEMATLEQLYSRDLHCQIFEKFYNRIPFFAKSTLLVVPVTEITATFSW